MWEYIVLENRLRLMGSMKAAEKHVGCICIYKCINIYIFQFVYFPYIDIIIIYFNLKLYNIVTYF